MESGVPGGLPVEVPGEVVRVQVRLHVGEHPVDASHKKGEGEALRCPEARFHTTNAVGTPRRVSSAASRTTTSPHFFLLKTNKFENLKSGSEVPFSRSGDPLPNMVISETDLN